MDNTEELLQESDFRFVLDNREEAEIVYERSVFKNLKKAAIQLFCKTVCGNLAVFGSRSDTGTSFPI